MKPPQYVARRYRIKFNRRRHKHSCPKNSPIDVLRLFHEILVQQLSPMPMTNMDLQGKQMTHHGTQNIRSLDESLSFNGFTCSVDGDDGLFSRRHVTPGGRDIWP
jgi:hypothetical protein